MAMPTWQVAQMRSPEGDLLARFRTDCSGLIGDSTYSQALWVKVDPLATSDLDALLGKLDAIEDAVMKVVEEEHKGVLLVTLTGAGYRDLVFAVQAGGDLVRQAVDEVSAAWGNTLQASLYREQKFGPYRALLRASEGAI